MITLEDRQKQFEMDLNLLKNGITGGVEGTCLTDIEELKLLPNQLNAAEHLTVQTHWWGFDINCNEKLTQDIISGTIASGPLATAIASALATAGVVTGGIATMIGAAFAAAFALKAAEIKLVDNGNGVHFPITWLQLAPVVSAIPSGPAGLITAIMVFIHPVRN
jgi:hypothetical protein